MFMYMVQNWCTCTCTHVHSNLLELHVHVPTSCLVCMFHWKLSTQGFLVYFEKEKLDHVNQNIYYVTRNFNPLEISLNSTRYLCTSNTLYNRLHVRHKCLNLSFSNKMGRKLAHQTSGASVGAIVDVPMGSIRSKMDWTSGCDVVEGGAGMKHSSELSSQSELKTNMKFPPTFAWASAFAFWKDSEAVLQIHVSQKKKNNNTCI